MIRLNLHLLQNFLTFAAYVCGVRSFSRAHAAGQCWARVAREITDLTGLPVLGVMAAISFHGLKHPWSGPWLLACYLCLCASSAGSNNCCLALDCSPAISVSPPSASSHLLRVHTTAVWLLPTPLLSRCLRPLHCLYPPSYRQYL